MSIPLEFSRMNEWIFMMFHCYLFVHFTAFFFINQIVFHSIPNPFNINPICNRSKWKLFRKNFIWFLCFFLRLRTNLVFFLIICFHFHSVNGDFWYENRLDFFSIFFPTSNHCTLDSSYLGIKHTEKNILYFCCFCSVRIEHTISHKNPWNSLIKKFITVSLTKFFFQHGTKMQRRMNERSQKKNNKISLR